jgi:hypothetical protein
MHWELETMNDAYAYAYAYAYEHNGFDSAWRSDAGGGIRYGDPARMAS